MCAIQEGVGERLSWMRSGRSDPSNGGWHTSGLGKKFGHASESSNDVFADSKTGPPLLVPAEDMTEQ